MSRGRTSCLILSALCWVLLPSLLQPLIAATTPYTFCSLQAVIVDEWIAVHTALFSHILPKGTLLGCLRGLEAALEFWLQLMIPNQWLHLPSSAYISFVGHPLRLKQLRDAQPPGNIR